MKLLISVSFKTIVIRCAQKLNIWKYDIILWKYEK